MKLFFETEHLLIRQFEIEETLPESYGGKSQKIDSKQIRLLDIDSKCERNYLREYWKKSKCVSKIHVA